MPHLPQALFVGRNITGMTKITILTILLSLYFVKSYSQKYSIDEVFNKKYIGSVISKGDNFPDFGVRNDSMNLFLICLHNDITQAEFQKKVKFDNQKMQNVIQLLKTKNWLHEVDNKIKPSIFIATKYDGEALYKYAKPISEDIAKLIKRRLPEIEAKFSETDIAKRQSFKEWDFLVLSDVLLDNWQIFDVEKGFLGASARPIRHGMNYYASFFEQTTDREGFNIYGNQYGKISVYGNNRSIADLTDSKYSVNEHDNIIFSEIAKKNLPDLVGILNKHKNYSKKAYKKLGYSKEITFEEFYIWWYHFIYTQATDIMNENKTLTVPKDGNFVYRLWE